MAHSRDKDRVEKEEIVGGSGNVFEDIGFANAEERLIKSELARRIGMIIDARRLTQLEAAAILGIDQPKVSNLKRGNLSGFSIERLLRFMLLLGQDVEIRVKEAKKHDHEPGHLKLAVA